VPKRQTELPSEYELLCATTNLSPSSQPLPALSLSQVDHC
jgi:hypothetical protein